MHGALLDANLLAEVYGRMTRGQESLVIDATDDSPAQVAAAAVDLTSFDLPVLAPTEEEEAGHDSLLRELDEASRGKTIWRQAAMA